MYPAGGWAIAKLAAKEAIKKTTKEILNLFTVKPQ
jgi:hypothetical protein